MQQSVTSLNTKRMLADSLRKICARKPFSKVTISEIVADCGVNRKTFYYHFEDIYALLKWTLEEEAMEVLKGFDLLVDYEEAIQYIMDYVSRNDYIINCAYDSMGRDEMKRFFYTDFIELVTYVIGRSEELCGVKLEPDFKEYLSQFYTEALAGMLISWMRDPDRWSQQQVIHYVSNIMKSSLTGILQEYKA